MNKIFQLNIYVFLMKYIVKSKIFMVIMGVISSLVMGDFIASIIVVNNGSSQEWFTLFNKMMMFYIVITTTSLMLLVFYLSFQLFSNTSKNGLEILFSSLPVTRRQMLLVKTSVLSTIILSFVFVTFFINMICSGVFAKHHKQFLIMSSAVLFASLGLLIIISPLFIFGELILKAASASVVPIILIFTIIGSFFMFRLVSVKDNSEVLNYNQKQNYNNYVNVDFVDNEGNVVSESIGLVRNPLNTDGSNTNKNIDDMTNSNSNIMMNFSLGEIFTSLFTNSYSMFNGWDVEDLETKQIYDLTNNDYTWNLSRVSISPNSNIMSLESESKECNMIPIAYQDEDPFKMSYEQFRDNVFQTLNNAIKLTNTTDTEIQILHSKLERNNLWGANINLLPSELDLLRSLAGGDEENHFIFYYIKNYDLLKNKFLNIYDDIEEYYGAEVSSLLKFLWDDKHLIYNTWNNFNIMTPEEIQQNFPMLGVVKDDELATTEDLDYFKNTLIHFNNGIFKVLNSRNNTYDPIDMTIISPTIVDQASWNQYVDQNAEVMNLKSIYTILKNENSGVESVYRYHENYNDLYVLNSLVNIESKNWINTYWVHLLLLFSVSGGFGWLVYRKYTTMEVK